MGMKGAQLFDSKIRKGKEIPKDKLTALLLFRLVIADKIQLFAPICIFLKLCYLFIHIPHLHIDVLEHSAYHHSFSMFRRCNKANCNTRTDNVKYLQLKATDSNYQRDMKLICIRWMVGWLD